METHRGSEVPIDRPNKKLEEFWSRGEVPGELGLSNHRAGRELGLQPASSGSWASMAGAQTRQNPHGSHKGSWVSCDPLRANAVRNPICGGNGLRIDTPSSSDTPGRPFIVGLGWKTIEEIPHY